MTIVSRLRDSSFNRCHFEGHERNCSDMFIPTITDEGECCSFNIMPEAVMFKNDVVMVRINQRQRNRDFVFLLASVWELIA